MSYFVIVYRRQEGKIVLGPEEFIGSEGESALTRRFALEKQFGADPDVEVVVIGSESLENVKRTHGRYFKTIAELAAS